MRLRPVRLRLFRLHPVRADAGLHHQLSRGFQVILCHLKVDLQGGLVLQPDRAVVVEVE